MSAQEHAQRARARKVGALVAAFLDAAPVGSDLGALARAAGPAVWDALARAAGTRAPSSTTVTAVVDALSALAPMSEMEAFARL